MSLAIVRIFTVVLLLRMDHSLCYSYLPPSRWLDNVNDLARLYPWMRPSDMIERQLGWSV
jgi:hypothetical protein